MDRWYTDRDDHAYTTETGRLFRPDVICPVDEICDQPITKLMFLGHPRADHRPGAADPSSGSPTASAASEPTPT